MNPTSTSATSGESPKSIPTSRATAPSGPAVVDSTQQTCGQLDDLVDRMDRDIAALRKNKAS